MDLSMNLIKADLIMAKQGMEQYRSHEIKQIKNLAAYHLQQAVEKMIKIQIYRSGVSYENREVYVHDLTRLIHYADTLEFGVNIPAIIRTQAIMITDWEANGRYDIHFSVRISTLEKIFAVVDAWYQELKKKGFH